ncbi:MAG: xanthine dehydrogenase molybdopterin binding subunit [Gammaproteobacteria bacterium]|nr:xanthine dehydrogenase molybdopterin binding subunit [Gammaproteobacteria bacterium]
MSTFNQQSTSKSNSPIGQAIVHDSAHMHVQGSAPYIDDMPIHSNTLHAAFALSKITYGKINGIDISLAQKAKGVHSIMLAEDISHLNIGPIRHDEPLLAKDEVLFCGQALAAVLADSHENARKAATLIKTDITQLSAIVTVEQALAQNSFLDKPLEVHKGNAGGAIESATHRLSGNLNIGGQEHYYLESQVALAIPTENKEVVVYSSTQNPTEVQHLVAHVLGLPQHNVEVITRRMGGGFGGKETDSSQLACVCALFAQQTQRPVKARLSRVDDMLMTGKRHDFIVDYEVGFDDQGLIQGVVIDFAARCGYSLDLSKAIISRTLFHADNAYYLPNASFRGFLCKTHTASNTAFRGFGGPQGMLAIENIIEEIANHLSMDAFDVRTTNFYQQQTNNVTPYGQTIEDNIINELTDELAAGVNYQQRRQAVKQFNLENTYLKKGLALSPVKFGISFTKRFLNQAGALVHIYKDGSIYLNHGGTEMGQGLFVKIAQVVANEFGVELNYVKVSATSTAKVPNTSATAASSGSDLNGMAAREACIRIKKNMIDFAAKHFDLNESDISFSSAQVYLGEKQMTFVEFVSLAYLNRVELFSNGFYKTPKVFYDEVTAKGRPFYYYSYGACVSEVVIDCLTGEYKLLGVDILHDVGASLNPAIDMGQIVGGYIQGMGWLCSEDLKWDKKGALLTTGASTYKIPAIGDTPKHFKVKIQPNTSNHENTIHRSKAVGEPPLMLAISAWLAIKNAIFNADKNCKPSLNAPATFEEVFFQVNQFNEVER